jgi:rod shape-determining protein MreC
MFLTVSVLICIGLIILSQIGFLSSLESVVEVPLNLISGFFNRIALTVNTTADDLAEIETLRERNAELEETLAQFQAELVELREITSDYQRLADLLDYTLITENQVFLTADVIALDQSGLLSTMVINRGTRDGIAEGMPVVAREGLIGRIMDVTSNAARVQLITDSNSVISARLQTTRAEGNVEGSVMGEFPGQLTMTFIPLGEPVQSGDLVITSGLGGNLPSDIVIGQVTNVRQVESGLYQEADVQSLVDFGRLEFVLVMTSFEPIDLTVFDGNEG